MSAADILKMIETVDPSDTAKLDEIDARVWCWRLGFVFKARDGLGRYAWSDGSETYRGRISSEMNYTRSRDALKAIRPEGWTHAVDASLPEAGIDFDMFENGTKAPIRGSGKTEELAELHAIIQAIEHERTNK